MKLTKELLTKLGFKIDRNGNPWINLQTHYIELMEVGVYWYPSIVYLGDLTVEESVPVNRIQTLAELELIIKVVCGDQFKLPKL